MPATPKPPRPAGTPPKACLQLSATPALVLAGQRLALGRVDAALLAWLALEGPTSRLRLVQLLWPEKDLQLGRNALRQRLFQLRQLAGFELVSGTSTLALAPGVAHDLNDSNTVLGMQDLAIGGEFGHWLVQQRLRRQQRVVQALVEQADAAEHAQAWDAALGHAAELLALQPLSEPAHQRLMRLHYLAGNRAAALLAFDACERLLKHEVGVRPGPQTLALLATIERAEPVPRDALMAAATNGRSATASQAPRAKPPPPAPPASVMRPPRLVGRQAQWAALEAAWQGGQLAIVSGDAGMGKTRLVSDFAATRGQVVMLRAMPGDARVIFGTVARLLRLLQQLPGAALAELPAAWRSELARLLPELAPPGAPPPPALATAAEHTRLANVLASLLEHPLLPVSGYVFDDLHFADDASVEILRFAALGASRRWILAARLAEGGVAAQALLQDQQRAAQAAHIALPPLTEPQVRELLADLELPGWDATQRAPELLRRTGGNPLFLLETIKAMLLAPTPSAGQALEPATAPGPLAAGAASPIAQLIERRISQLSPQAVRLARCAAVAVPDFSIALAAHVLGQRTLDLTDPWAELEAAQVFRDGSFAHDLIHESALASIPAAVARQLHAEIAEYLQNHEGASARIAEHWLQAGEVERALPALAHAADLARDTMRRREEAAIRWRMAELAQPLGLKSIAFAALIAYDEAMLVVDRTRLTPELFDRLESLASSAAERVQVAVMRASAAAEQGPYDEAIRLGEAAARLAREAGLTELEVHATRFAAASASHSGQNELAVRLLRQVSPWVLAHGSEDLQWNFCNDLGCCLDNADQPQEAQVWLRRALDVAIKLNHPEQAAVSCGNMARGLKAAGRCAEALAVLQDARRYALAIDEAGGAQWNMDLMSFALLRDLARYAQALRMGELAAASIQQHPPAASTLRVHQAMLWLHLGQTARAQQVLAESEAQGVAPHARGRHYQVKARIARMSNPASADGAALIEMANSYAAASGRLSVAALVGLDHASTLPAPEGLAQCLAIRDRAAPLGYAGVVLAAQVRGVALALRAQQPKLAAELARAAMATPEAVTADDIFPAERWLNVAEAFTAVGDELAASNALAAGHAWLTHTAAELPEVFRESFLERVPMNRALRAAVARQP